MSSLIFYTDKDEALIATDTLATSPDGQPFSFTTKAYIVPHLKLIIAGTGAGGFLSKWFLLINDRAVFPGIDFLNNKTARYLGPMWSSYKQEFSAEDQLTTTVYHFGFSEITNVIKSFAYRSTNGFQSESIPYGLGTKPPINITAEYNLPQDLRSMMDTQRTNEESRPLNEKVFIGGEIQVHHLTHDGFHVYTLDRFEDYESDRNAIYKVLKASTKD
jgi:hypothetical protein